MNVRVPWTNEDAAESEEENEGKMFGAWKVKRSLKIRQ